MCYFTSKAEGPSHFPYSHPGTHRWARVGGRWEPLKLYTGRPQRYCGFGFFFFCFPLHVTVMFILYLNLFKLCNNIMSKKQCSYLNLKILYYWEYPGGPVIRTYCFHCWDPASFPSQGSKILQAMWCSQKIKKRKLYC